MKRYRGKRRKKRGGGFFGGLLRFCRDLIFTAFVALAICALIFAIRDLPLIATYYGFRFW